MCNINKKLYLQHSNPTIRSMEYSCNMRALNNSTFENMYILEGF